MPSPTSRNTNPTSPTNPNISPHYISPSQFRLIMAQLGISSSFLSNHLYRVFSEDDVVFQERLLKWRDCGQQLHHQQQQQQKLESSSGSDYRDDHDAAAAADSNRCGSDEQQHLGQKSPKSSSSNTPPTSQNQQNASESQMPISQYLSNSSIFTENSETRQQYEQRHEIYTPSSESQQGQSQQHQMANNDANVTAEGQQQPPDWMMSSSLDLSCSLHESSFQQNDDTATFVTDSRGNAHAATVGQQRQNSSKNLSFGNEHDGAHDISTDSSESFSGDEFDSTEFSSLLEDDKGKASAASEGRTSLPDDKKESTPMRESHSSKTELTLSGVEYDSNTNHSPISPTLRDASSPAELQMQHNADTLSLISEELESTTTDLLDDSRIDPIAHHKQQFSNEKAGGGGDVERDSLQDELDSESLPGDISPDAPLLQESQLVEKLQIWKKGTPHQKLQFIFNIFDLHREGRIRKTSVVRILRDLYDMLGEVVTKPTQYTDDSENNAMPRTLQRLIEKRFNEMDTYQRGYIAFDQYERIVYETVEIQKALGLDLGRK